MRGEYYVSEVPKDLMNAPTSPFIVYLEIKINQIPFSVRMTSLHTAVVSMVKETDKYADILKMTLSEAFHALQSNITDSIHIQQTVSTLN